MLQCIMTCYICSRRMADKRPNWHAKSVALCSDRCRIMRKTELQRIRRAQLLLPIAKKPSSEKRLARQRIAA